MKKIIMIGTAMAMIATGLTGCSLFQAKGSGEKGATGWYESGKQEAEKGADAVKETAKKGAEKVKDVAKKGAETATEKINDVLKDIAYGQANGSISGDYAIETVLGTKAVGETAPFLKFVPSEGRIYGNNGCNVLNGKFKSSYADKTISFSDLATTMMMCGQTGITDIEISQALQNTAKYTLDETGYENILTFYNANGQEVMQLMHRDFHFLDGIWKVEKINGEAVNIEGMKLALDVDEKRVHGNTGCNIINGDLEIDMDTANSISFSGIGMTRMACPDSGWETRMVMALEEAVTAKKITADEIEFLGSNGQQVMLLKRTDSIDE